MNIETSYGNFWSGDDNYQDDRQEFFRFSWLHHWLAHGSAESAGALAYRHLCPDGTHSVSPNELIFPLTLAIAASELTAKMGISGNPVCPQKYFLKGRKTQRFCGVLVLGLRAKTTQIEVVGSPQR